MKRSNPISASSPSPSSPPPRTCQQHTSDGNDQESSSVNYNNSSPTAAAASSPQSDKLCMVCNDKALGYNFNAVTCESCKAFFRRNALAQKTFVCPFNECCIITAVTRRFCQKCRLDKCFAIGMRKEYIMSKEEKLLKKLKIEQNRKKRKSEAPLDAGGVDSSSRIPSKIKREVNLLMEERDGESSSGDSHEEARFKQVATSSETSEAQQQLNMFPVISSSTGSTETQTNDHLPSVGSSSADIVDRLVNFPEDSSKLINNLMKSPKDAVAVMTKIIQSQKDAMRLIGHLIGSPGDALKIISKIMNSPFDALTVFTKFMSSPNDALEIIAKIASCPEEVLQFIQQLMNSPEDALQIMQKFMNSPAEALKMLNQMVNNPSIDSTTKSETTTTEQTAASLKYDEEKKSNLEEKSSSSIKSEEDAALSSHSMIKSMLNENTNSTKKCTNLKGDSITSCDLASNSNKDDKMETNNNQVPSPMDTIRGVLDDISDEPIIANTLESLICEAISLEYDLGGKQSMPLNRDLNDAERAKLNELIVANKALYAPVDEDLTGLDECSQDTNRDSGGQDPQLLKIINLTAIAIRRLIKMSKKINAFRNMCQEDQVALLKGGCTEMMILRSAMQFDSDQAKWQVNTRLPKVPNSKEAMSSITVDVLKLAKGNVYEVHERFIRTFEPKWRQDENIILILSAIVLFTPNRPKTIHTDVLKLEQKSYYYLLRRYLESVYPGCEAKSTFLKLIQKISDLQRLNDEIVGVYLDVNPKQVEPLLREIFDLKNH